MTYQIISYHMIQFFYKTESADLPDILVLTNSFVKEDAPHKNFNTPCKLLGTACASLVVYNIQECNTWGCV